MILTFLMAMCLICQIDTSDYQYHGTRYSTLLSSKTKHAEMTYSMKQTIFEPGDTIEVIASIKNIGKDTLMVWDPDYFGYGRRQIMKELDQEVYCDLYTMWDGQWFKIYKLMKLFPGDSSVYKNYIVIDSSLKIDTFTSYGLTCGGTYFVYNEEFEYLTEGSDSTTYIKSSHIARFFFYTYRSYIGTINFSVVDKIEHFPQE